MSKFTCLVLCVVAASISNVYAGSDEDEFHEAVKPLIEECSKDHGVSDDEIESAKTAGNAEGIKPCFLGCLYKKADVFNSKGEYDVEKALIKLKDFVHDEDKYARFAEIGRKCASINEKPVSDGDAGCERAAMLTACFLENKGGILV